MGGLTKLEQEYVDRKRNGESVVVSQQRTPDGAPFVTLKVDDQPAAKPETEPESTTTVRGLGALSVEDIRRLVAEPARQEVEKPATTAADQQAEPIEIELTKPVDDSKDYFCRHCGWDRREDVKYEPSEGDKEEFVRAVLGSRGFEKLVTRLGGKVSMRFITPSVSEEDRILAQLKKDADADLLGTPEAWWSHLRRYRAAVMLQSISGDGFNRTFKPSTDYETIKEVSDSRFGGVPAHLLSLTLQGLQEVDSVYSQMVWRADQPDFWDGSVG
jgi:hypothetical protein